MHTFQNTVTIARPVSEVFAFLADLRNIPRWNYAIARTVPTSPGPAGAGATYRQTRTIPRRSEESLQITVFQPPARLAVQGRLRPVPRHGQLPARAQCRAGLGWPTMSSWNPYRPCYGRSARWRYPESRPGSHVTSARSKSCWKAPAQPPKSVRDVRDRAEPPGGRTAARPPRTHQNRS